MRIFQVREAVNREVTVGMLVSHLEAVTILHGYRQLCIQTIMHAPYNAA